MSLSLRSTLPADFSYPLQKLIYYGICFSKSFSIGFSASQVSAHKDGLCPFVSDCLDLPTFPTLCKSLVYQCVNFPKSLAIGPPASRVVVSGMPLFVMIVIHDKSHCIFESLLITKRISHHSSQYRVEPE